MIGTAHQYKIRLEKRDEEIDNIDFNISDVDLNNSSIEIIDRITAKEIIEEYEWLKKISSFNLFYFGIYFNINNEKKLGGVVVYSNEYSLNTGTWEKYGFSDKIILLSRGVCLWWTPKNTASYFISKTYDWLKKNTKYRIITATVDPIAGEIGTIYQSLNWYYVGLLKGNYSKSGKELKRYSVLIDGKLRTLRSIRNELKTSKKEIVLKKYPNAEFIPQYRKRRYFYFIGNNRENKKYFNSIKHLILPYPKRNNKNINGLIYKITNKTENKIYIGQTTRSFIERIEDYQRLICNTYLKNAFKKYGFNNFLFEIIDTAHSLLELDEKEKYYIKKYNSNNRLTGYNIQNGGRNFITSDETKKKQSKSKIKQNEDWVNKRISKKGSKEAKKYGKPKNEDDKKILSKNSPKYWLNKNRDEETKNKISLTKKNNGVSDNFKIKIMKKVESYNPITDETIKIFNSTKETAKHYNLSQSTISRICNGKIKNKGDVYYRFV